MLTTQNFKLLHEAGCIQTGNDGNPEDTYERCISIHYKYFLNIMVLTKNNPCDGCPVDKSKCEAFKKYHSSNVKSRPTETTEPVETVAQIAKRLGISKNEVRRRKRAGLL